jgi:sugar lactone lactonase YvrE
MPRKVQALILCAFATAQARAEVLPFVHGGSAYADAKGQPLKSPRGIACTDNGRVVVADTGNGRLMTFQYKDGEFVDGTEVPLPQPGVPTRVQIDRVGAILALDARGRRIARIGAPGEQPGYVALRGVPDLADGFDPVAFRVGKGDEIWVLDLTGNRVVLFDPTGAFVRQIALPAGSAISDVALTPRGSLYAVDPLHGALYEAKDGGFKLVTGKLKEYATFPSYVEVTDRGLLLLVDSHGMGIVVIAPDGSFVGRRLSLGWNDGQIYYPEQICFDRRGELFVADRGNHRVQAFTSEK